MVTLTRTEAELAHRREQVSNNVDTGQVTHGAHIHHCVRAADSVGDKAALTLTPHAVHADGPGLSWSATSRFAMYRRQSASHQVLALSWGERSQWTGQDRIHLNLRPVGTARNPVAEASPDGWCLPVSPGAHFTSALASPTQDQVLRVPSSLWKGSWPSGDTSRGLPQVRALRLNLSYPPS